MEDAMSKLNIRTVADVEREVARIESARGDDEIAHTLEDDLHQDVLRAIATGDHEDEPSALAEAALKTRAIDFSRWCA
jgi:hypothetical protein